MIESNRVSGDPCPPKAVSESVKRVRGLEFGLEYRRTGKHEKLSVIQGLALSC